MSKKEEKQEGHEDNGISQKQASLIKELYEETEYKRAYSNIEIVKLTNPEAQKHIEFLLEYKKENNDNGCNGFGAAKFDKIAHCMIYKLVWKNHQSNPHRSPYTIGEFEKLVYTEYRRFKDAQAYAKKHELTRDSQ